jgi:hypothetical protein
MTENKIKPKPVKRATENRGKRFVLSNSAIRFADFTGEIAHVLSDESLGYYRSSAARTKFGSSLTHYSLLTD